MAARVPLKGRFRSPRVPSPRPPTAHSPLKNEHRCVPPGFPIDALDPISLSSSSSSSSSTLSPDAGSSERTGAILLRGPHLRIERINLVFTRRIARPARIPALMRIGQFTRSLERLVFPLALRNLSLRQVKRRRGGEAIKTRPMLAFTSSTRTYVGGIFIECLYIYIYIHRGG